MKGQSRWAQGVGRVGSGLILLAPLALCWPMLRHLVESRMSLHMLLEFPILLASGWLAWRSMRVRPWGAAAVRALTALDPHVL